MPKRIQVEIRHDTPQSSPSHLLLCSSHETMKSQILARGANFLAVVVFGIVYITLMFDLTAFVILTSQCIPWFHFIHFINDIAIDSVRALLEWLFLKPWSLSFDKIGFYNCAYALEKDLVALGIGHLLWVKTKQIGANVSDNWDRIFDDDDDDDDDDEAWH